jgi:xanthine/uracil permease
VSIQPTAVLTVLPVVIVLVAENVGHVKAIGAVTGRNVDRRIGDSLMGDGLATMLAGFGGGSGTTTYAENIGVMAVTKIYSTAAYAVAAFTAIAFSFSPKFGALIQTVPNGAIGGATIVLFGLIGMLGIRIWIDNKVDFTDRVNFVIAGTVLIVGLGDLTLTLGGLKFAGLTWATVGLVVIYPLLRKLSETGRRRSGELSHDAAGCPGTRPECRHASTTEGS